MAYLLILFTLFGHLAIWVGAANRLHAIHVPEWFNKLASYVCHACLVGLPFVIVAWNWNEPAPTPGLADETEVVVKPEPASVPAARNPLFRRPGWPTLYYVYCWIVAGLYLPWWLYWRLTNRSPHCLTNGPTTVVDTAKTLGQRPAGNTFGRFVTSLPFNQVFKIHVQEKSLELPQLDAALDGLTIAHVSDWHFKGRIGKGYYEEAVRLTNETRADLICLTGDLFDKPEYLDWIPETLGRLRAKYGVYFILGNHDIRHAFTQRSRELLSTAGLIDLGVAPRTIDVRQRKIFLAGNERPWIPLAPELRDEHASDPAKTKQPRADLRVLLSHSPDQFRWGVKHGFDLMLAGHTHGGQVRLPLIGAIYSPSLHGVKYAGGVFYRAPTVMHVTRGIASELPLRINCPPEITKLTLVTVAKKA